MKTVVLILSLVAAVTVVQNMRLEKRIQVLELGKQEARSPVALAEWPVEERWVDTPEANENRQKFLESIPSLPPAGNPNQKLEDLSNALSDRGITWYPE